MLVKKILILALVFSSLSILARDFKKIPIPGAVCGDGTPYYVYFDGKSEKDLVVELMGGGACWDYTSCYGVNLRTWIHHLPDFLVTSVIANDESEGPLSFKNFSYLYFPYCTGDIHIGSHIGEYGKSVVYHVGKNNLKLTLDYLTRKNILKFKKVDNFLLWGSSAGALGAMINSLDFDKYLNKNIHKVLIADAPGLHWGEKFWEKFNQDLLGEFHAEFAKFNVHFSEEDGLMARYMGNAFLKLSSWKIGILQGTRDLIMSSLFGDIDPAAQEKLIYSNEGIINVAKDYPNTSVFISKTYMHTFLILDWSSKLQNDSKDQTAIDFLHQTFFKLPHLSGAKN